MARLLVEIGGVAASDLFLVQGRGRSELSAVMETARRRLRQASLAADTRVLFIFYFSGHSDGRALEMGGDRLGYDELKAWLAQSGSDVRLIIIDSCRSGALFAQKGGAPIAPFDIHLIDDLPTRGEATIASSAANENSLEVGDIRGSVFTHHLLSGLRGAADSSGDGRVSLAEAYRYAFVHTTSSTADTLAGVQHPSYDYRLSGQGELVLTELRARSAGLTIPGGFRRVLITEPSSDDVVAELTTSSQTRLALQPGVYSIQAWKGDSGASGRIKLAAAEERSLNDVEWGRVPVTTAMSKGGATNEIVLHAPPDRRPLFVGALGGTSGVARGLGVVTAIRAGMRSGGKTELSLTIDGVAGSGPAFVERRVSLLAGYGFTARWRRLQWFARAEVGVGWISQETSGGETASSLSGIAGPSVGGLWWVGRRVALLVETDLQIGLYARDSKSVASIWPAGFVGIGVSP